MVNWVNLTEAGEPYGRTRERLRQIAKKEGWETRREGNEVLVRSEDVQTYFSQRGVNIVNGDKFKYFTPYMEYMGLDEFRSEIDFLFETHNPDEMNHTSKVAFAATLTMQLRRKGYGGSLARIYHNLSVDRTEVHGWYQNLFGERYAVRRKIATPRFESRQEKSVISPYEVSRFLGMKLPFIITAIKYGELPAEERDGVYEIPRNRLDVYENFFNKWKPVKTTAKLLGVGRKIISRRVETGMIRSMGESPAVLINVEDSRRACSLPIAKVNNK